MAVIPQETDSDLSVIRTLDFPELQPDAKRLPLVEGVPNDLALRSADCQCRRRLEEVIVKDRPVGPLVARENYGSGTIRGQSAAFL